MTQQRAILSVVLGLLALVVPALAWAYVIATELRNPQAFHDQGGMAISFCFFPLAMVAAMACGVPAFILAYGGHTRRPGAGGSRWRWAGPGLSILGFLLAIGTCIGPQMLAEALR
ncbi:MAG TPA: hypothetical protein VGI99_02750 [Gemmataceae bacterium]